MSPMRRRPETSFNFGRYLEYMGLHNRPSPMMNSRDPTNEYMYQVPVVRDDRSESFEGGDDEEDGEGDEEEGTMRIREDEETHVTDQSVDARALHDRLAKIGLTNNAHQTPQNLSPPRPDLQSSNRPLLGSAFKTNPVSPNQYLHSSNPPQLGSAYKTNPTSPRRPSSLYSHHTPSYAPPQQYYDPNYPPSSPSYLSPSNHQPPTAVELGPSDSLSQMYRPYRGPAESIRSVRSKGLSTMAGRRGGTNVDPVDGEGLEYGDEYVEEQDSAWETRYRAPTDVTGLEQMTLGRTEWAGDTVGGGMQDMRDRLLSHENARAALELAALNAQMAEATTLATALSKLENTEEQLRTLQATLIAERVARDQIERSRNEGDFDVREVKNELASAVRALRRAKDEAKRNEEERRRLARCFEETKVQLYKYHEELRVRDARAKGREEGRAEAWQEAERWMGGAPPIPGVEPVSSVPQAVLRQTPMTAQHTLPPLPTAPSPMPLLAEDPPRQPTPTAALNMPSIPHQMSQMPTMPQMPEMPQMPATPSQHLNSSHDQHTGEFSSMVMPSMGAQQPQQPLQPQHTAQSQMHPKHTASHAPSGLQPQHTATTAQPAPTIIINPQPAPGGPMIMVPARQMPQMPQMRALQPYTQNIPQTTPHHTQQLPPQPQSKRAATVYHHSQPMQPLPPPPPTRNQTRHTRSNTIDTYTLQPPTLAQVPSHHAAESYLDRIDRDSHVRDMMTGARSKTIHTFQYTSHAAAQSLAGTDKPLPAPSVVAPSQHHTVRPSRGGTVQSKVNRRASMLEQLHAHPHHSSELGEGDRYPVFPHRSGPKIHSRGGSMNSVDPAGIALPFSAFGTPATTYRAHSMKGTPQTRASGRSKIAAGLRAGTDFEELSDIQEDEREAYRGQRSMHEQGADQSHPVTQPQMMGDVSPQLQRQRQHYAPSMPGRAKPVPRMPQPLGRERTVSEPHYHPPTGAQGVSALFRRQDSAGELIDRQPEPPISDKPVGAHDMYVPPGMAPFAVHGSVHDVQGPRTSALGLEGLEHQTQHLSINDQLPQNGKKGKGNKNKDKTAGTVFSGYSQVAPTITIQPPSSQNPSRANTRAPSTIVPPAVLQDKTPKAHSANLPKAPTATTVTHSPQPQLVKRQTVVTETFKPSPVPLNEKLPHDIPLPPSRPHAPTVYSGPLSPDTIKSQSTAGGGGKAPTITAIDWALRQPLPESRPTTIFDMAPQMVPLNSGSSNKKGNGKPKKKVSPPLADPRQVPLPASRAGTHRQRASTYAGTVGPIEEVTEEESLRSKRK